MFPIACAIYCVLFYHYFLQANSETAHRAKTLYSTDAQDDCLRIVLGIFTVANERDRRDGWRLIFKEQGRGLVSPINLGSELQCGFNYVFVFGGNTDESHDSVVVSEFENMNNGKSYKWWCFAAENFPRAHIIAKMDSDTMICPAALLSRIQQGVQCGASYYNSFYIGNQVTFVTCGKADYCPKEYTYASGGLHFLSQDLVQWIRNSPFAANHTLGPEDLLTGMWLHNSQMPVKFINMAFWKESFEFDSRGWTGFLPGCRHSRE